MSKNRLEKEISPYLLQHKNNPIWWYPWGEEAFLEASQNNKLIFLSVGYSTCHWCHVMETDSFEKEDVAEILNAHFVSIKVDREERPDVDSLYMSAVQAMTSHGGWPMSVILTPDGKPFWGGTFIPHEQIKDLLLRIQELWLTKKDEIQAGGERVYEFLKSNSSLKSSGKTSEKPFETTEFAGALQDYAHYFESRFDPVNGGLGQAPKFPPALGLMALLRHQKENPNSKTLTIITRTLDCMRRGGIFDQVGGGFHRYSTDENWLVPHFEKMLYDNALLAMAYTEGFQLTKNYDYARTAQEIFNYVLRDMTSPDGGFYSAEDADSEGIEGKFYVWSFLELEKILAPPELEIIKNTFGVTTSGNFHAHNTGDEMKAKSQNLPPALTGNIFFLKTGGSEDSTFSTSLCEPLPGPHVQTILDRLQKIRGQRIRPHLDDKILTSWSSLMISAFARASHVFGDDRYLKAAAGAAEFILTKMRTDNGQLLRSHRLGTSRHSGLCDDYAHFIQACLDLYEASFDSIWIKRALEIQKLQNNIFWDQEQGGYFDSDGKDKLLITRSKTWEDGVTPCANSVSALNLFRIMDLTLSGDFQMFVDKIFEGASLLLEKYPQALPCLLFALGWKSKKSKQFVISSNSKSEIQTAAHKVRENFEPHLIIAAVFEDNLKNYRISLLKSRPQVDGKTTFYFCENRHCQLPVTDLVTALKQIRDAL